MILADKQLAAYGQSSARLNVCHGPVRSGKSVALEQFRWAQYVRTGPPGELLMCGRTLKALERNVLRPLQDLFGSRRVQYSIYRKEAHIFGRRIELEGGNDERAEPKIRGMTLAGALCNELTLMPESFVKQLLARMSIEGAQLFGTTNPGPPRHWLKTDFLDRERELNLRQWRFKLEDNPFLPESYVTALKSEYSGLWYKRFILGQWVAADGAIYDMFDEAVHVVDELPKMIHQWAGIDYGTATTFAIVLIGLGVDNCLYVIDESVWDAKQKGRQRTDSEHAAAYLEFVNRRVIERTFCDPSATSFMLQLSRLRLKNIIPADNTVLEGIRNVSNLFQARRLKVHKRCRRTREELQSYIWDEKAQERGEDKPVKANDHCLDCTRYIIRGITRVWRPWFAVERGPTAERLVLLPSQIANPTAAQISRYRNAG